MSSASGSHHELQTRTSPLAESKVLMREMAWGPEQWPQSLVSQGFRRKSVVSGSSTVVAAKNQVSSDLGGEVAILDLKAGMYYGLDEVGARIWELIQEPRAVREVHNMLLSQYDVERERCERDLLSLLQQLADEGLVEVRNESPE